jgi:hypothetical protein
MDERAGSGVGFRITEWYASRRGNYAGLRDSCFMAINKATTMSGRLGMQQVEVDSNKEPRPLYFYGYSVKMVCAVCHFRHVHEGVWMTFSWTEKGEGQPMRVGQQDVRLK